MVSCHSVFSVLLSTTTGSHVEITKEVLIIDYSTHARLSIRSWSSILKGHFSVIMHVLYDFNDLIMEFHLKIEEA